MFRYIAFIWTSERSGESETAQAFAHRLQSIGMDWRELVNREGLRVFCAGVRPGGSEPYLLAHQSGVVLGTLFERSVSELQAGPPRRAVLGRDETSEILKSGGQRLIDSYWGRYVAVMADAASGMKWVVRDPTGGLPCFVTTLSGVTVIFSCVTDCISLGMRGFSFNSRYLLARLAYGFPDSDETALNEVSEVRGGQRVAFTRRGVSRNTGWRPLEMAEACPIEDPLQAMSELRATTMACVRAWGSCYARILHRLSGGLDSSVVLGCLKDAAARPNIVCVKYYMPNRVSDEIPFARLAAANAACQLIELEKNRSFMFEELLHITRSVNPQPNLAFLERNRVERQLAKDTGATAIFNGEGGDSLFGSVTKDLAVVDYVFRNGYRSGLPRLAADVALLTNSSIWKVLAEAIRRRYFTRGWKLQQAILGHRRFLSREARESAADLPRSMPQVAAAPPGALTYDWLLRRTTEFYDPLSKPSDPGLPEFVSPLLSQPLMELCIRIPTYVHLHGGRDRGLARRAFVQDVPAKILSRHWKDRAAGSAEEMLSRNLEFTRQLLLDGILVKNKLLCPQTLEEALAGRPSRSGGFIIELFDHIITEAWLRTWTGDMQQSNGHVELRARAVA